MTARLATITLVLVAACDVTTPQGIGQELGEPTRHADPMQACLTMLAEAFPDTPRDAWDVHECGDLGVKATDCDGITYAVIPYGSIYAVDDGHWTLLAY